MENPRSTVMGILLSNSLFRSRCGSLNTCPGSRLLSPLISSSLPLLTLNTCSSFGHMALIALNLPSITPTDRTQDSAHSFAVPTSTPTIVGIFGSSSSSSVVV